MENLQGIFNATFTESKKQDAVSFEICECTQVDNHILPVKNGKKQVYTILISDEDNIELTRNEIRDFLSINNIEVYNIDRNFIIK